MTATNSSPLQRADFVPGNTVRWCPGCGDYNILASIQSILPTLGKRREDFVFISGIGCSSRFPYYLNTFGFHTIHGRAPAIASGVKIANPNLDVWVITGDGDGLSIGGNHLLHALRRNLDITILLFNNEIYGLTKGQYSPTSQVGTRTASTPYGSLDAPVDPIAFALGAGATFVARTADNDPAHMSQIFTLASRHRGVSFVEILQNCVIFNNKVHEPYYGREVRQENILYLQAGEPLRFGANKEKSLVMDGWNTSVVPSSEAGSQELIHDPSEPSGNLAAILARLRYPQYPVPLGVFRDAHRPDYGMQLRAQLEQIGMAEGPGDLHELLHSGVVWEV